MWVKYFTRTRSIFVLLAVSAGTGLLTHGIFSSFVGADSFLFPHWVEVPREVSSLDKRVLHGHDWRPSLVLVNAQDSLQEIDKGVQGIHLALRKNWLESVHVHALTLPLRLLKLDHTPLLDVTRPQVVQTVQLDVLLGFVYVDTGGYLKFFYGF